MKTRSPAAPVWADVDTLDDDTITTLAAFKCHRSPYTSTALAPAEFAGRFHTNTAATNVVTLGHSTFIVTNAATMHYLIVGTHAYGYYIAPAATGTVAKRYGTVLWAAL